MVEALKSSIFLYRWLLMFFLWMGRLSGQARWGVIIGAWVGYQVLRGIARNNPEAGKFVWPILVAYIVFCVMTWMAAPLLNLVLRVHRYGRHILSRDQTLAANWIGVLLAVAGLALVGYYLVDIKPLGELALVAGLLVPSVGGIFVCERGWPRNVMIAASLALAGLGLGAVGIALQEFFRSGRAGYSMPPGGGAMLGLFIIGTIGSILAVNALAHVRPRS
jgi:hypothetical protein